MGGVITSRAGLDCGVLNIESTQPAIAAIASYTVDRDSSHGGVIFVEKKFCC